MTRIREEEVDCRLCVGGWVCMLQAWLEGLDYNLKKVLQRDPLTNDEVIMELYREMSMQYVLCSVYYFLVYHSF